MHSERSNHLPFVAVEGDNSSHRFQMNEPGLLLVKTIYGILTKRKVTNQGKPGAVCRSTVMTWELQARTHARLILAADAKFSNGSMLATFS